MVVRSSLHRTKYSRGRPNAKKPDVQRELPPELRTQQLLTFDQDDYDLRGRVCELLRTVPSVGATGLLLAAAASAASADLITALQLRVLQLDENHSSALMWACQSRQPECALLLLQAGADPAVFPDPLAPHDFHEYAIEDMLIVPKELPAGEYVLGWRWDAEMTSQVWSSCADITIE